VKILGVFEEATKMLSGSDTCISSCIPIVTTIIKSLEIQTGDNEIMEIGIILFITICMQKKVSIKKLFNNKLISILQ